jgi:hypothetical protein
MLAWKVAQPLWASCSHRIGSSFRKARNLVCSRLITSNARTRSRRTSPGEEIKIRSVLIRRPLVLLSYSFRSTMVNVPISSSWEKQMSSSSRNPKPTPLLRRMRTYDLRRFPKTPPVPQIANARASHSGRHSTSCSEALVHLTKSNRSKPGANR